MRTEHLKLWKTWRRRRDENAFATLVRPEMRYAADLVRRLGASREEAEDAVQRSVATLAGTDTDEPVTVGLRAWLCRRAILDFRMQVRSATRRRKHERRPSPRSAPADPTRRAEIRDRVEHALTLLEDDDRQAVVLRYLDDLDYPEMAYVLGISVNACRIRVHKALKLLRGKLGPKAAALVALLGVPALPAEAAIAAGAAAGVTAVAAVPLTAKVAAAVLSAAALVTTAVVVATPDAEPVRAALAEEVRPPLPEPAPAARETAPDTPPPLSRAPVADTGAALRFLDAVLEGRVDPSGVLWDYDALASLVPVPASEPVLVDGKGRETPLDLRTIGQKADRVVLGPGRYRLTGSLPRDRTRPFELRGAGAGRTIIDATERDLFLGSGRMNGLIVRDLTFEGQRPGARTSGLALDARGTVAGLFTNVVFRGWQDRAGHGSPVGVSGRALLGFRDCEFVGGYRRASSATALSVRGDVLALFDSCRFSDHEMVLCGYPREAAVNDRSTVHFLGCTFTASRLADSRFARDGVPSARVRLRESTAAFQSDHEPRQVRLRRFGIEFVAEHSTLRFVPEIDRVTVADLRRAIDAYLPGRSERVIGAQAITCANEEPVYVIHVVRGDGSEASVPIRLRDGTFEPLDASAYILPRIPPWPRPAQAPPLGDLLASMWDRLRPETPCHFILLGETEDGRPRIHFYDRYHRGCSPERR